MMKNIIEKTRWVVSVSLFVIAIVGFFNYFIVGLLYFVLAVLIMPKTKKEETKNSNIEEAKNSENTTIENNNENLFFNENEIESIAKHYHSKRQQELKSFKYNDFQINSEGFKLLESLEIIANSKNIDTLKSRYELINSFYDNLVKASHNKNYKFDIQKSINNYQSVYHDKKISSDMLGLVLNPSHESISNFYYDSIYFCFKAFLNNQQLEINSLKRNDAKEKRIEKIIDVASMAIAELSFSDNENAILDIEKTKDFYFNLLYPEA